MKHIIVAILVSITSGTFAQNKITYNLNKPYIQQQLPAILNEVSGLSDIDSNHVACVQDELGIVFVYNFIAGKIVAQHKFDDAGDFEGLTYTKNGLYILRSDGRLTRWNNFPEQQGTIKHFALPMLTANNEGLCYDEKNNRLLIAAKSKPTDHAAKAERFIYAYDITKQKLIEKPVYSINTNHLEVKARSYQIKQQQSAIKGKSKPFNFRPSSLAVHPVSNNIYIISASDQLLIVMNRKGDIIHMEQLNAERFVKAEGITFLADGTMIITNEAGGKTPTLLVYKMELI